MTGQETRASKSAASGFTLVELLVVIAIIATLASLLLPTLARAKALGAATQCKSNLRQLAQGLSMYIHDNNGVYPGQQFGGVEGDSDWPSRIAPQLGFSGTPRAIPRQGVLKCPTHRLNNLRYVSTTGHMISYGYNSWGAGGSSSSPTLAEPIGLGGVMTGSGPKAIFMHTREAHIQNPADMLALGDGFIASRLGAINQGPSGEQMYEADIIGRVYSLGLANGHEVKAVAQRHRGRLNMVFCDGHVEDGRIHKWYFSQAVTDIRRWNVNNRAN